MLKRRRSHDSTESEIDTDEKEESDSPEEDESDEDSNDAESEIDEQQHEPQGCPKCRTSRIPVYTCFNCLQEGLMCWDCLISHQKHIHVKAARIKRTEADCYECVPWHEAVVERK